MVDVAIPQGVVVLEGVTFGVVGTVVSSEPLLQFLEYQQLFQILN